jgi:predicted TPR repeat methyltransferase
VYLTAGWHDPKKVAELAKDVVGEENVPAAHVLDMGCGTGLVGKYLNELGFRNIEGIDASAGMI